MSVYCDGECSRPPTAEEAAADRANRQLALDQAIDIQGVLSEEAAADVQASIDSFEGYRRCTLAPEDDEENA